MTSRDVSIRLRFSDQLAYHYDVRFFQHRMNAVVTRDGTAVLYWILDLFRIYGTFFYQHPQVIVGLGTRWRPANDDSAALPATIQLCFRRRCLVFQIIHANYIPYHLMSFLADPKFIFVGWTNNADRHGLWRNYGLVITNGWEMMRLHRNRNIDQMADLMSGAGMRRLVGAGSWDASSLTFGQVQYACLDTYLAYRVGVICASRPQLW